MSRKIELEQDTKGIGFYTRSRDGGYFPLLVRNSNTVAIGVSTMAVPLGIRHAHNLIEYFASSVTGHLRSVGPGLQVNLVPNNFSLLKDDKTN